MKPQDAATVGETPATPIPPELASLIKMFDERVGKSEASLNELATGAPDLIKSLFKENVAEFTDLVSPAVKTAPVTAQSILGDTLKLLGMMSGVPALAIGLNGIGQKFKETDPEMKKYREERDLANILASSYPQLTEGAINAAGEALKTQTAAGTSIYGGKVDLANAITKGAIDAKNQLDIERNRNEFNKSLETLRMGFQKELASESVSAQERLQAGEAKNRKEIELARVGADKELAQFKAELDAKTATIIEGLKTKDGRINSRNLAENLLRRKAIDFLEDDADKSADVWVAEAYDEWVKQAGSATDPTLGFDQFHQWFSQFVTEYTSKKQSSRKAEDPRNFTNPAKKDFNLGGK